MSNLKKVTTRIRPTLLLFTALVLTMTTSCKKETSLIPETTSGPQFTETFILTADILAQMNSMGAVQGTAPSGWTPVFTGTTAVYFYSGPGGEEYEIYAFQHPGMDDYIEAQRNCTKAWHDGGGGEDEGCYNSGTACDLELRNGKTIIICCDEEPET